MSFDLSRSTPNGSARAKASAAVAEANHRPTAVVSFRSRGRLLILGSGERVRTAVSRLAPALESLVVLLPRGARECDSIPSAGVGGLGKAVAFHAIPKSISGYLGKFQVRLQGPEGEIGLEDLTASAEPFVDLVLDFAEPPRIGSAPAPHGYFAPGDDPVALERALAEIPELIGEFEQPKYVSYDPSICAHGRSGIAACTRCLDACAREAIRSDSDRIAVDLHLCQGAGSCATACPTGALRYAYPHPGDSLQTLKAMLRVYRDAGGEHPPALVFHDAEAGKEQLGRVAAEMPDWLIPFQVQKIASVGMEVWLTAMCYGASTVTILGSVRTPAAAVQEIEWQLSYAYALLAAMGYFVGALRFLPNPDDDLLREALRQDASPVVTEPASFAVFDDKRTVLHLALDYLHRYAPEYQPLALLPTGAPFGEVCLSAERCTLCMACVSQCPTRALQAGDESPQLKFIEDNCVQCGLCARSCPEDAIDLSPRYLFDDVERRRLRVLKEEEPFRCIVCGKPFATASVIGNIMTRLRDHPMFDAAQMERLKMCEDCRVQALYEQELRTMPTQAEKKPWRA